MASSCVGKLFRSQRFPDVLLDKAHLLGAPDGDQHSSELTRLCLGPVDEHHVDYVHAIFRRPLVRGCFDDREQVLALARGNHRRFTKSPGRNWCQWNLLGGRIAGNDLLTGGFSRFNRNAFGELIELVDVQVSRLILESLNTWPSLNLLAASFTCCCVPFRNPYMYTSSFSPRRKHSNL